MAYEKYYEHPKGYRPKIKGLEGRGVFISDMKPGQKFTASNGRKFQVERVRKTPLSDSTHACPNRGKEIFECDMWAKCIATGEVFLFHYPVNGRRLYYTFIIEEPPKGNVAIAIDGPAGAGKTTQAKALAKELGYTYVDTGALYRGLAVYMKDHGVETETEMPMKDLLKTIDISFKCDHQNGQCVYLNSVDITNRLRTPEISMLASSLSAIPAVRAFLLNLQRDIARKTSVVMEGRDIGTIILPDADVKFFLTADPLVRAYRRKKELMLNGIAVDDVKLVTDMAQRDYTDSHREEAPLKKARDAIELDCSEMSIDQTTISMLACIKLE